MEERKENALETEMESRNEGTKMLREGARE